jgi:pre-rRNA-processing protein TSR3
MDLPTLILRHRRENLKKCSLSGLEKRPDLSFFSYPKDTLPDLSQHLLLQVGAPLLTLADANLPLFLIDGTWKLTNIMTQQLKSQPQTRSLPSHYRTAYPRRQTDCLDPHAGLASIEALYIAHLLLGRNTEGLLDRYHWKNEFLILNGFSTAEGNNLPSKNDLH